MYWIALVSEIERQFIFIAILAFQSLYTLGLNEEKSTYLFAWWNQKKSGFGCIVNMNLSLHPHLLIESERDKQVELLPHGHNTFKNI